MVITLSLYLAGKNTTVHEMKRVHHVLCLIWSRFFVNSMHSPPFHSKICSPGEGLAGKQLPCSWRNIVFTWIRECMCWGVILIGSLLFWKARYCIDLGVFGGAFQYLADFVCIESRLSWMMSDRESPVKYTLIRTEQRLSRCQCRVLRSRSNVLLFLQRWVQPSFWMVFFVSPFVVFIKLF